MVSVSAPPDLRQRADYTYRFNDRVARHGWLRLTPAYSVRIVEELLDRHPEAKWVFDPFCGTGTTALSAIQRGTDALTIDINPFLVWLARAKTARYSPGSLTAARRAADTAAHRAEDRTREAPPPPAIHNISRWWGSTELRFLCRLKASIGDLTEGEAPVSDLLRVAFCRTLMRLSNAAFNHQSMSFRAARPRGLFEGDAAEVFRREVEQVLAGASQDPAGRADVRHGNALEAVPGTKESVDLVITSPPYANRMSYVRELRPYMYWTDYFRHSRDAGELDWRTIGGTWGIATSRLSGWEMDSRPPAIVAPLVERIRSTGKTHAATLGNYVAKYFSDMEAHFRSLVPMLDHDATVHYVVGNSVFYGVLVPTEEIFAEMLDTAGFAEVDVRAIRKRNSKRELFEFVVSATWR